MTVSSHGVANLLLLNVAAVFSAPLLPVGAQLGLPVLLWDVVAALGCMLPTTYAVKLLLKHRPDASTLYEVVVAGSSERLGNLVVLCEWVSAVIFTVPLLEYVSTAGYLAVHCGHDCLDETQDLSGLTGRELMLCILAQMLFITVLQHSGTEWTLRWLWVLLLVGNLPLLLLFWGAATAGVRDEENNRVLPLEGRSIWSSRAAGVVFGFAGIEVSAFHLHETSWHASGAVLLSVFLVLVLYAGGQLAVALLVPMKELSVDKGVFQALRASSGHSVLIFNVSCGLSALGGLAATLPWLFGPVSGLAQIYNKGEFNMVLLQNGLAAFLGWIFLCTSAATGFWWFTAAAAATSQCLYMTIYVAAFQAKARGPDDLVLALGFGTSLLGFVLGLKVPEDEADNPFVFVAAILSVVVALVCVAFCTHRETSEDGDDISLTETTLESDEGSLSVQNAF